jgi:hypothetical protein
MSKNLSATLTVGLRPFSNVLTELNLPVPVVAYDMDGFEYCEADATAVRQWMKKFNELRDRVAADEAPTLLNTEIYFMMLMQVVEANLINYRYESSMSSTTVGRCEDAASEEVPDEYVAFFG